MLSLLNFLFIFPGGSAVCGRPCLSSRLVVTDGGEDGAGEEQSARERPLICDASDLTEQRTVASTEPELL